MLDEFSVAVVQIAFGFLGTPALIAILTTAVILLFGKPSAPKRT